MVRRVSGTVSAGSVVPEGAFLVLLRLRGGGSALTGGSVGGLGRGLLACRAFVSGGTGTRGRRTLGEGLFGLGGLPGADAEGFFLDVQHRAHLSRDFGQAFGAQVCTENLECVVAQQFTGLVGLDTAQFLYLGQFMSAQKTNEVAQPVACLAVG